MIDECDAGLAKLAVPIFVADEFIGVAGGCGPRVESGEVETFAARPLKRSGYPDDTRLPKKTESPQA